MAVSAEQLREMLSELQKTHLTGMRDAVQTAVEAATAASATARQAEIAEETIRQSRNVHLPKKGEKELDTKSFTRVDKFDGGELKWADWRSDMEVILTGLNSDFANLLKTCHANDASIGPEYYNIVAKEWKDTAQKRAHELLGILFILVTGEAKTLIKAQTDGLEAWRILCQAYSRRTLARTLRLYKEAIIPSPAKSITEVITKISEWENKVNDLVTIEGKSLDPMIKLAALTEICTPDLKDMVYQQIGMVKKLDDQAAEQTYKEVREKVISWVSNRVAASDSVNLNIGHVQADMECYPCDENTGYLDINAMMGKCYTCGGIGHPARLCPTTKGQGKGKGTGKGGEGFGKGGPKGGGKGGGTYYPANQPYNAKGFGKGGTPFRNSAAGNKGGGKGYQGTCWTCGMVGHKSAECRTSRTNLVEAEEEETEASTREIGGVWIMHVAKVQTKNRYQTLTRTEEEGEEGEGQGEQDHHAEDVKTNRVTGRKWKKIQHSPEAETYRQACFSPIVDPGLLPAPHSPKLTDPGTDWETQRKTRLPRKGSLITGLDSRRKDVNVVEKLVAAASRTETAVCQMTFHLTDANKILASVNKMTETGNEVVFNKARSFIKSPTGRKAFLKRRNGVYLLDVIFFNGDEAVRGEVIIDSGAADHVMPRGMLEGVVTREKEMGIRFVAADGAEIGNYGRKDVQFVPTDFWEEEFGSPFTGRA
jgi:hypothetical protein